MGFMKDRVHREFAPEDIQQIVDTYQCWKVGGAKAPLPQENPANGSGTSVPPSTTYQDIKGYCKSASLIDIKKHSYVLTPGRYVGIPDEEDDGIPFEDKMKDLTATLAGQIAQEKVLDAQLKEQLAKIGFEL